MFKVGGKVICIKSGPRTTKGKIYFVYKIDICKCGATYLHLGFFENTKAYTICDCGQLFGAISELWHYPKNYIPLEEEEFKAVTYTRIIESLPVGVN